MKYLKNLMIALTGNNPYQMELDQVREEYEKTAERVRQLEKSFYDVEEKRAEADELLEEYKKWADNAEKELDRGQKLLAMADAMIDRRESEITSLRTLVENLREHLDEKDAQMAQMNVEFDSQNKMRDERLNDYLEQIARLQDELKKAKNRNKKPNKKQDRKES